MTTTQQTAVINELKKVFANDQTTLLKNFKRVYKYHKVRVVNWGGGPCDEMYEYKKDHWGTSCSKSYENIYGMKRLQSSIHQDYDSDHNFLRLYISWRNYERIGYEGHYNNPKFSWNKEVDPRSWYYNNHGIECLHIFPSIMRKSNGSDNTHSHTVKELKAICKANGIKGYSKLKKHELYGLLMKL